MKQTAVEWLIEETKKRIPTVYAHYVMNMDEVYKQSKAMEKEQIIEAFYEGLCDNQEGYPNELAKQYYNETFKSE